MTAVSQLKNSDISLGQNLSAHRAPLQLPKFLFDTVEALRYGFDWP
jgi:hypothetical protein